jgi:hypothetical protein
MHGWKNNYEVSKEKCRIIMKFWQSACAIVHKICYSVLVIRQGNIYMKYCIKVHSIVFQIIVDSVSLNEYILQWYNASEIFFEENYGIEGSFLVLWYIMSLNGI